jgi:hypothetical protein
MSGSRVPGRRKELAGQAFPTLNQGEYGLLDDVWWACPPDGQVTAVSPHAVHDDGTITAEFKQLGKKYRIDHGVWEPPVTV